MQDLKMLVTPKKQFLNNYPESNPFVYPLQPIATQYLKFHRNWLKEKRKKKLEKTFIHARISVAAYFVNGENNL